MEKDRAVEKYLMIVLLLSPYGYPYLVIIERKIAENTSLEKINFEDSKIDRTLWLLTCKH